MSAASKNRGSGKAITQLTFYTWWFEDIESSDLTFRHDVDSRVGGGLKRCNLQLNYNTGTGTFSVFMDAEGQQLHLPTVPDITLHTTSHMSVQEREPTAWLEASSQPHAGIQHSTVQVAALTPCRGSAGTASPKQAPPQSIAHETAQQVVAAQHEDSISTPDSGSRKAAAADLDTQSAAEAAGSEVTSPSTHHTPPSDPQFTPTSPSSGHVAKTPQIIDNPTPGKNAESAAPEPPLASMHPLGSAVGRSVLIDGKTPCVWDLHVGTQLDILGRRVTLMQASAETACWLDEYSKRVKNMKCSIESELIKYKPKARPAAMLFDKGSTRPGGLQVSSLVKQVLMMLDELSQYRPSRVEFYMRQLRGL